MPRLGVGTFAKEQGQPTDEIKRAPISMRVTPAFRVRLEQSAAMQGRSLAQEVEQRLERSLVEEERRGGPALDGLIGNFVAYVAEIEATTGKAWTRDLETFGAVRAALIDELSNWTPIPAEYIPKSKAAEEALSIATAQNDAAAYARANNLPGAEALMQSALANGERGEALANELERALKAKADKGRQLFFEMQDRRTIARRYLGDNDGA